MSAKHKGDGEVWKNDHKLLVVLRMRYFIFFNFFNTTTII